MTENEQERIVKLLFPVGLCVTIWSDGAEKVIHGLEYHVDKRTEAVTEVVTEVHSMPVAANRIHIFLETKNFSSGSGGMNSEANLLSVQEQVKNIRNWDMPVDFVLTLSNGMKHYIETVALYDQKGTVEISGCCPDSFFSLVKHDIIVLQIRRNGTEVSVWFQNRDKVHRNLLLLYENNDCVIDGNDKDVTDQAIIHRGNWDKFEEEIRRGYYPVVYLKSPTSERYYPVSYQYTISPDNSVFSLVMEISYYKETNGVMELWIEKRTFMNNFYQYAGNGRPEIKKVVLGTVTNV